MSLNLLFLSTKIENQESAGFQKLFHSKNIRLE